MTPTCIDDYVPTEEEVGWMVRRLWGIRLGGPSGMCAEHLREWIQNHWVQEAAAEVEEKEVISELWGRGGGTKYRREEGE